MGRWVVLTRGTDFTYLATDEALLRNRWKLLIWDLTGLEPTLAHAQGLLVSSNIGDLAIEY